MTVNLGLDRFVASSLQWQGSDHSRLSCCGGRWPGETLRDSRKCGGGGGGVPCKD